MEISEIINQYKTGKISYYEAVYKFCTAGRSIFQTSSVMADLDMTWTIGDRSGVVANILVPLPGFQDKLEVKLRVNETDLAQATYWYLFTGKLLEQEELNIFFQLLDGGVMVDIGANIGWYSILAALSGASSYAFEPIQDTYQRLCDNIRLNGAAAIKAFHLGLGEEAGEQLFYYHKKIPGASSRVNLDYFSDGLAQKVRCPMDTLDNVLSRENIDRLDLIKCDVEGGELFVFRGAAETIKKYRPFVLSEMLRKWSAKFGYYPDEIINLFSDLGYKCIALCKDKPGCGYVLDHMLETTEETNFLFVPLEKENDVRSFMSIA